jgi:hypothetical protein
MALKDLEPHPRALVGPLGAAKRRLKTVVKACLAWNRGGLPWSSTRTVDTL